MNSAILSFLSAFAVTFAKIFKESRISRMVNSVYNAFSKSWSKSVIMTFLRRPKNGENAGKSLLFRILNAPFSAMNFAAEKLGRRFSEAAKKSFFINLLSCFMNNILAINTRFYGCIILAVLTVRELALLKFGVGCAVFAVIGIALALTNFNVTDFLSESRIIRFCLSAVGFGGISLKIYDKNRVNCHYDTAVAVIFGLATGVLSLISPILAIAAAIGLTGLCIVMSYPICGVFFAFAAAPFVPTMVLAGICILSFISLFAKSLTDENFRWKTDRVGTGLILLLVFLLISSVFSFAPVKSITVWIMYLIFVGFYFVIINTVKTKEQLYSLLKVFAIAGVLVSIYGIIQYVFGLDTTNAWIDEDMFEEATMRAYSTMGNPNVLGEYLLLLIPISAVFMIKGKGKERLFYFAATALGMLCMVFTQSRGCWLGLILSAAVFVTFYNGKLWGLAPLLLLIIPFVIPQTMVNRMMSVGNLEDSSTSYRVFIWLGTLQMLKDFLLGGIGMGEGAFRTVYPLYSYNAIIAPHSHNTYLQLLVEGGICTLLIFIAVMCVFFKTIHAVYAENKKHDTDAVLALAVGSGILGFLLQSMFDYTFYNYRMMAMFFMITAAGTLQRLLTKEAENENN